MLVPGCREGGSERLQWDDGWRSGGEGGRQGEQRGTNSLRYTLLSSYAFATSCPVLRSGVFVPQEKPAEPEDTTVWRTEGSELIGQKVLPNAIPSTDVVYIGCFPVLM